MQKIVKKFVEVMRECSHVAKNGTNDFHKYKYATATDILEKVNTSLTKHGLASVVTPNLLSMQQVTTAKANSSLPLKLLLLLLTLIPAKPLRLKDSVLGKTLPIKQWPRRRPWL